jgi:hypothetical protein
MTVYASNSQIWCYGLTPRYPVEVRLQICSYVVSKIPLIVPSNKLSSLLYSCKAIQGELGLEPGRLLLAIVTDIMFMGRLEDCNGVA